MSLIDKPIAPTKRVRRRMGTYEEQERQRRLELLSADRERKLRSRTSTWDAACARSAERALPPAVTLIPWHLDERGCWARTVGNAG